MKTVRKGKKTEKIMEGGTLTPRRILEKYPEIKKKSESTLERMSQKDFVREIRNDLNGRMIKIGSHKKIEDKEIEEKLLLILENVFITTLIESVVMKGNVTFEEELKKLHFSKNEEQVLKKRLVTLFGTWSLTRYIPI